MQSHHDILILDGPYLAHKSHWTAPDLKTSQGFPTGTIHAFINGVFRALKDNSPNSCVVTLEGGGEERRAEYIPGYKQNRPALPDAMSLQLPVLWELCDAMGWPTLKKDGYEADDVIYTILEQRKTLTPAPSCAVYTIDKDLLSLLTDNVVAYRTLKGHALFTTALTVETDWGVKPHLIPDVLSLCGDDVDEIPGIPTLGKKTAIKLIQNYGTAAQVYSALERGETDATFQSKRSYEGVTKTLADMMHSHKDQWLRSTKAVELQICPLNTTEWCRPIVPDMARVTEILTQLEMFTTLEKMKARYEQAELLL